MASQPEVDISTHAEIIEEMADVMKKLALAYIESRHDEPCLHCDAYDVIERARGIGECVPVDEVLEAAQR